MMEIMWIIIAIVCLLYYGILVWYAGIRVAFSPIWLVGGLLCLMMAVLFNREESVATVLLWLAIIGLLCLLWIERWILCYANMQPVQQAEYLIVLGAKVNGVVPSKTLMSRIKKAYEYLQKNDNTIVIVSGGQGKDEEITEALAMKRALVSLGINENRILMEERSVNTEQNLRFSKQILEQRGMMKQDNIVITTSDFHLYRAISLAKKQGFHKLSGYPSKPDAILALHYHVRECCAIIKDKIVNHI